MTTKEQQDQAAITAATLMVIGMPAWIVAMACAGGFLTMHLWQWFVVPTFGVSAISLPVAIGLRMLLGGVTSRPDSNQGAVSSMVLPLLMPFVALGIAYVVHLFM